MPAMVDGMVVDEAEIEDRRHLEHASEINGRCQLLGNHGANAIGGAQEICSVLIDEVGDVPGFLFEAGAIPNLRSAISSSICTSLEARRQASYPAVRDLGSRRKSRFESDTAERTFFALLPVLSAIPKALILAEQQQNRV